MNKVEIINTLKSLQEGKGPYGKIYNSFVKKLHEQLNLENLNLIEYLDSKNFNNTSELIARLITLNKTINKL